jgi:proline iminopeptidase
MASVFEIVARDYCAILPDQRGTGLSQSPFEPGPLWTVEGAVADLEAVRRQSEHERWIIVGHSWGARLAMAYAAAHPDRVAGLVLVSPGGLDPSYYEEYHASLFARLDNEQLQLLRQLPRPIEDSPEMAGYTAEVFRIFIPAMLENQAVAEVLQRYLDDATVFEPQATLNMNRASLDLDLRGKFTDYKSSCVIIRGEQDPISRTAVDKIADQIRQTTIIEIDGAAHWSFLENAEEFNAALAKALALFGEG